VQRRREAERDPRHDGDAEGDPEDGQVDVHLVEPWDVVGCETDERAQAYPRERDT
jgi:hypothetical protein